MEIPGGVLPGAWFSEPPLSPSRQELSVGAEALKRGMLPVSVDSYHVEVFDMSDPGDRSRYEGTMKDLFAKVQANQCVVWRNELQVLQRGHDTGWHRYLEWSEYSVPDEPGAGAEAVRLAKRDAGE